MRPDIVPGGAFPDYALPDQTGTVRRLSELQGRDPLILTLARGNYCPKEHQQHLDLARAVVDPKGFWHSVSGAVDKLESLGYLTSHWEDHKTARRDKRPAMMSMRTCSLRPSV